MRYEYECPTHGRFDESYKMGEAPRSRGCGLMKATRTMDEWGSLDYCVQTAVRVFTPPQFTEDRTRFWNNGRDRTRYSAALGMTMPDSRAERDRVCKEKGIEFVTRREVPADWKAAVENVKAVRAGHAPAPFDQIVTAPKPKVESLVDRVRRQPERLRGKLGG
ncbi:MAG: hypothetical protein NVSMB64_13560 [Candidatus Velthaea sp.]